jgi:phosphoribosyl 1,2-cyclic phosphodiesterase
VLARIWGCRGSLAAPGPQTVRYGGNTSCVELRAADGTFVVLDAGTGIRPLGMALLAEPQRTIHLLLTHLHLDHLEGLGFFAPLWNPETDLHIWGPPSPLRSLRDRITGYFSPPLFPVHLSAVPAQLTFHDVPDEEFEIAGIAIRAQPVEHPGPTVAFRFQENGRSLAYVPDHEPALGGELRSAEPEWVSGRALVEGVDVLVHDAQYTDDEYATRQGWGHSSYADTVAFARITEAGRLVMFHHDPMHSDGELESMLGEARALWAREAEDVDLAHEGMEIHL